MLCCTMPVLLLAWLGLRSGAAATPASVRWHTAAWVLWGAGLGGLAYVTAVMLLLAGDMAVHVDATGWCGSPAGVAAVPVTWVAARWTLRTVLLAGAAVLAAAAALALLRREPVQPMRRSGHRVAAGFALAWMLLSALDHQVFGLYALTAGGLLADLALHAAGLLPWIARFRADRGVASARS
ncbi:hypothetical protein [Sinimarinibacterium flocculans]|uniref:hypothetical protein n=1 Tax=Sinimarinibacterium flocculans TaxID=985250 RepID=UPI0035118743